MARTVGWEVSSNIDQRRIDAGRDAEWLLSVRIPVWFGIDGSTRLTGTLTITPQGGDEVELPLSLPVPIDSPLVDVRAIGIDGTSADIEITNQSAHAPGPDVPGGLGSE